MSSGSVSPSPQRFERPQSKEDKEKQNSMTYSAPKKTSLPEVSKLTASKSKQNTPNRDSLILGSANRATKSMPRDSSLIRPPPAKYEEVEESKPPSSNPSNNSNDMEYQEYMNL